MKKIFTLFAVTLCAVTINATEGALSHAFTVDANGNQVYFSKGNLQYQASSQTWQFAANQYDFIGAANANISATNTGWIDLFGWGTGSNPTFASQDNTQYTTFTDWGSNAISNGGNTANTWRTLTTAEWAYLFNSSRGNYGEATVNGICGVILLPDDWSLPTGLTFVSKAEKYASNVYDATQWAQMEANGAVFLPAAGYRDGTTYSDGTDDWGTLTGMYWSSTPQKNGQAHELLFIDELMDASDICSYALGISVRLVQNIGTAKYAVTVTQPAHGTITVQETGINLAAVEDGTTLHFIAAPETGYEFDGWLGCPQDGSITITGDAAITCGFSKTVTKPAFTALFSVDADGKQVTFSQGNLQYRASTDTWRFAAEQYEIKGQFNTNIAADYAGWIDLFGHGTGSNPTLATTIISDYTSFTDWGINPISNGKNQAGLWRTLTYDEWLYLLNGRANAASLRGQATIEGQKGYVLLPDSWTLPVGATFTANSGNYTTNQYTAAQWAELEANGAIFLPAAGYRRGLSISEVNKSCIYRHSSNNAHRTAGICLDTYDGRYNPLIAPWNEYYGSSVRLVKNHQQPTAVDNIRNGNVQCTKRIVNGQMVIEKNGKLYNALGAEVR